MKDDKVIIREKLEKLVEEISRDINKCPEYVANEMFYAIQRHKIWGRNATQAQKNASFKYYKGICQRCKSKRPIDSIENAKFHHNARGIPGQHNPNNLVPHHLKCHDEEHSATRGSLSKGSPIKEIL